MWGEYVHIEHAHFSCYTLDNNNVWSIYSVYGIIGNHETIDDYIYANATDLLYEGLELLKTRGLELIPCRH